MQFDTSLVSDWHHQLFKAAEVDFEPLRGKSLLLTGMSGFLGLPFIDFCCRFLDKRPDAFSVTALTRDKSKVAALFESLYGRHHVPFSLARVNFIECDIREVDLGFNRFDVVVHGISTPNSEKHHGAAAIDRFNLIVESTKRIIEISKAARAEKFIFLSSGAVYGRQTTPSAMDESLLSAPDVINDPEACYAEAKRVSEFLLSLEARHSGFSLCIARCFSFCGPFLSTDIHFSIMNFLVDALRNKPIMVTGDPETVRSYMYTYDLPLLMLRLIRESSGLEAVNVGSEHPIRISELAQLIQREVSPSLPVIFSNHSSESIRSASAGSVYYPNVDKLKRLIKSGEIARTDLKSAVRLIAAHYRGFVK